MTYEELVNHFGKPIEVSRKLNITPQAVCIWKDSGVPLIRQFQIEVLTQGKLKAERNS